MPSGFVAEKNPFSFFLLLFFSRLLRCHSVFSRVPPQVSYACTHFALYCSGLSPATTHTVIYSVFSRVPPQSHVVWQAAAAACSAVCNDSTQRHKFNTFPLDEIMYFPSTCTLVQHCFNFPFWFSLITLDRRCRSSVIWHAVWESCFAVDVGSQQMHMEYGMQTHGLW